MTGHTFDDHDDDAPTIDDLRLLVKHISELSQLGDAHVVRQARAALLVVTRASAKRLSKTRPRR